MSHHAADVQIDLEEENEDIGRVNGKWVRAAGLYNRSGGEAAPCPIGRR
jgi:hypothetical protein